MSCAILKLDQEKAFDRVDHSFLFKVLERMNFGENFRNFIKVIYSDVFSSVMNNGYFPFNFQLLEVLGRAALCLHCCL